MLKKVKVNENFEKENMNEVNAGSLPHGPCYCDNCGTSGNDATHSNMKNV